MLTRRKAALASSGRPWSPARDAGIQAWWDTNGLVNGAVATLTAAFPAATRTDLTQTVVGSRPTVTAGVMAFDGVDDTLTRATLPATLIDTVAIPDGSGGDVGKGYTITGLTRAPDGTWWTANDGRNVEGSATYLPSLVQLSADRKTKLNEILLAPLYAGIQTVQGIAYDTSDNTLWFVDQVAKKIRHISTAGSVLGGEITTTIVPNGLAYEAASDYLWVGADSTDPTPNVIERWNAGTAVFVDTRSFSASSRDHFHLVESLQLLLVSSGANGTAGIITAITYSGTAQWTATLSAADAVEGIHYDEVTGILTVANDAYFHLGSSNTIQRYQMPLLSATVVDLWYCGAIPATTGTDAVFTVGDPLAAATRGLGIYPASTTNLRVFVNTGGTGTTEQALLDVLSLNLTALHICFVRIDTVADTVTMWINGTQVGQVAAAMLDPDVTLAHTMRLCSAADGLGRFPSINLRAVGYGTRVDRRRLEKYLGAAYGIAV